MKLMHIVGARPNFMKAAPVLSALASRPSIEQVLVHTGQHYDAAMSDVFFQQLGIPAPDVNLEVGSGSHAQQTAEIIRRFEPVLLEQKPDWLVVYGDVNSTVACALVAAKLGVRIAHVEAGLRSFDRTMPEEINRILTDQLADMLLTPSEDGNENLRREGVAPEKVFLVGNVMIDTLVRLLGQAPSTLPPGIGERYALVTLHRPANVDEPEMLARLFAVFEQISADIDVVFPVHPRTRQRLAGAGLSSANGRLHLLDPLPYLEFLELQKKATVVITDSGGIQEETSYLNIPCLTMRENTERPVTVAVGSNILVGRDTDRLLRELRSVLDGRGKRGSVPPLWDGRAGERIADIFEKMARNHTSL